MSCAERQRIKCARIKDFLQDGFGVEDIAIRCEMHVDTIRFLVRKWRASGELEALYRQAK